MKSDTHFIDILLQLFHKCTCEKEHKKSPFRMFVNFYSTFLFEVEGLKPQT